MLEIHSVRACYIPITKGELIVRFYYDILVFFVQVVYSFSSDRQAMRNAYEQWFDLIFAYIRRLHTE